MPNSLHFTSVSVLGDSTRPAVRCEQTPCAALVKVNQSTGDELTTNDGYFEPAVPPEQVRQDPYPLTKDFEWSILDINDAKQVRFRRFVLIPWLNSLIIEQGSLRSSFSQLCRGWRGIAAVPIQRRVPSVVCISEKYSSRRRLLYLQGSKTSRLL